MMFVRSQDNLAVRTNPKANGHVLTEFEVRSAFGDEVLARVLEEGVIALASSISEPSETLRRTRESLGLTTKDVAKRAKLSEQEVNDAEDRSCVNPIQILERLAIVLGLDERILSYSAGGHGDEQLAGRLKALRERALSVNAVSALSEASWVIRTQYRLMRECGRSQSEVLKKFTPNENYGGSGYPAYRQGYYLAGETRKIFGLSPDAPISSLRDLCEAVGIAVVQTELSPKLAGATIAVAGCRGIALNINGPNANVWVRRATLAHELGHLFWDSEERLEHITVDDYKSLNSQPAKNSDRVEARANAFAIALLAPPTATARRFEAATSPEEGLRDVMSYFGLSLSAAKHHIENCIGRAINVGPIDHLPTDEWKARENSTVDYFPDSRTPFSRRGKFAENVIMALDASIISEDSAARYLNLDIDNLTEKLPSLRDIFSNAEAQ
ncbi:ImmA/IrrE family metallo-endopeptidase [Stenotrophomonas maltophilia]|uniref:ImmA/IrrE family metallo-endopeptidase n=1 Tax=Stenotrophomonas maltophilia TaxID=40324 RepID=UPI00138FBA1F|nr:XRE family transcriptional regulator [Stenotrophomonas maltophilia]